MYNENLRQAAKLSTKSLLSINHHKYVHIGRPLSLRKHKPFG